MGLGKRIGYSLRCFLSILLHGQIPANIALELGATPTAGGPVRPSDKPRPQEAEARPPNYDRAVQMLALLQREGRLIDFFAEDVTPYPDAQLGAAVRSVHQSCRQALEHYVKLEPIISSEEDRPVTVQAGFDPAAIKVIGNVTLKPRPRFCCGIAGGAQTQVNLLSLPRARAAP